MANKTEKEEKKVGVADKINEYVQSWFSNANSITEGFKTQFSTEGYRGNSKEYYDNLTANIAASDKGAANIRSMLKTFGRYVNPEWSDKVLSSLDEFDKFKGDMTSAAKEDYDEMSKYASQQDYDNAVKTYEEQQKALTYDWESALKEVEADQAYIDAAKKVSSHFKALKGGSTSLLNYYKSLGYSHSQAALMVAQPEKDEVLREMRGYVAKYGEEKLLADTTQLQEEVNSKRAYANSARHAQLAPNMEAEAKADPEFEAFVQKGLTIDNNKSWYEDYDNRIVALGGIYGDSQIAQGMISGGNRSEEVELARAFTEDQVNYYSYYLAKYGKKKADEYYYAIEKSVQNAAGQNKFDNIKGNRFMEFLFGVEAGLDQFTTGIENFFRDDFYIPASADQITSSMVREDLADVGFKLPDWLGGGSLGQGVYDFTTTTSNMMPSILIGTVGNIVAPGVGSVLGAGTLGLSAAGHAYTEAINLGYDRGTARTYGFLIGGSEATLQYVLGGIGSLGGKVGSKAITSFLGSFDNALFRAASKFGNSAVGKFIGSMASEGAEEYFQSILEPVIRNAVLEENNEINFLDPEALYSGVLGAISAGFLEGGGVIIGAGANVLQTRQAGNTILQAGKAIDIADFVKSNFAADTVAYKIASKVNENTGAYTIGKMFREAGATLSEQNKTDIKNALIEKGVTARDAETLTNSLATLVGSDNLSDVQEQLLQDSFEANDVVTDVINEVLINPNSTVNQRMQPYNEMKSEINAANFLNALRNQNVKAGDVSKNIKKGIEKAAEAEEAPAAREGSLSESDISFLQEEAKRYDGATAEAFLDMAEASELDAKTFARAFRERFLQGTIRDEAVSKLGYAAYLDENASNTAYKLGIAARKEQDRKARQSAVQGKNSGETSNAAATKGKGKLVFDKSVKLDSKKKVSVRALERVAEATGVEIHLYESYVGEDGERVYSTKDGIKIAENGYFDPNTNRIYIDVNAGLNGEGIVLFTASHELTHFIANWSKLQFNVLADFVTSRFNVEGISLDDMIKRKMKQLDGQAFYDKLDSYEKKWEYAREEVIADSMEAMFKSGRALGYLTDLHSQHEGLFNKIRGFIKKFAERIRVSRAYKNLAPQTSEGQFIAQSEKAMKRLEKLFAQAAKGASENYAQAEVSTTETLAEDVRYSPRNVDKNGKNGYNKSNGNTDGGISNAEQRTEKENVGRETQRTHEFGRVSQTSRGTREEAGNRSRVSEEMGEAESGPRKTDTKALFGINSDEHPFGDKAYVTNNINPSLQKAQREISNDYGVECYVVHKDAWTIKNFAASRKGKIYISEAIDADTLKTLVPHETTHIMKQGKFSPYLDFVENTPELLNMHSDNFARLMDIVKDHIGIDYFNMKGRQVNEFYDELNSIVYGFAKGGIIDNSKFDYGWLPSAFQDFDAYIDELTSIHEQFKAERKGSDSHSSLSERFNSETSDIRYSSRFPALDIYGEEISQANVDLYSEKQYNSFGWARVNGIISPSENDQFHSIFTQAKRGKLYVPRTKSGEYMIAIGEDGLQNVIVFASGTTTNIKISKVIRINLDSNTLIEETRSDILETERFRRAADTSLDFDFEEEVITRYTLEDCPTYQQRIQREKRKSGRYFGGKDHQDHQSEQDGRGDPSEDSDDLIYSLRNPESNRELLANALESLAENEIDKKKLAEYKENIAKAEAQEAKFNDLVAKKAELEAQQAANLETAPSSEKAATHKRLKEEIFKVNNEIIKTRNRITFYDKKLFDLESTASLGRVLENEKKRARRRARDLQKATEDRKLQKRLAKKDEQIANIRRKRDEKIADLKEEQRQREKERRERRNATIMRNKVKELFKELDSFLRKGTKEHNVKIDLQPAVAYALEAINLDTVGAEKRLANIREQMAKETDPEKLTDLAMRYANISGQNDRMQSRIEMLKKVYEDIKNSKNAQGENYQVETDAILEKVNQTLSIVGDTSLRDMTAEQLCAVYDLYKMVLTTVQNVNKLWKEGKAEDLRSDVREVALELSERKSRNANVLVPVKWARSLQWNQLIPVYAFERLGSDKLKEYFWELIRGQNTYARDIQEAKDFAEAAMSKYGVKDWDLDKTFTLDIYDGRKFEVTLDHLLSIYAYSKRNQALEHMRVGGFFYDNDEIFSRKGGIIEYAKEVNPEGYYVDDMLLAEIATKHLTKEQIGYVDEMQAYLTKMGEKGNEVSRIIWGIDIFTENIYFPLHSSQDFIKQQNLPVQESSLKNDGMTKATIPGANNPIILQKFHEVWANHINRMAMYHAYVIPIENLNKIRNYGTWVDSPSMSISTIIGSKFGVAATNYINQFLKDMNGSSTVGGATNPLFGLVANFKKTAVGMSSSTVVQQPTAIIRAMALVDSKYFVGMPVAPSRANMEELKTYAPIAIIKEIGGFDAGGGRQTTDWLTEDTKHGLDKVKNKVDEFAMWGASIGDRLGWLTIWEAVKREVADTTNLVEGSAEHLEAAGERFTEVVVYTQVYDSTLSRSGFMRAKHDSVKMATAFMGEPTVTYNMTVHAVTMAQRGKMGKTEAAKWISVALVASVAASMMASLPYALRDDDEDESFTEKYFSSLGGSLVDNLNPANLIPFVRDVMSIISGWDVERSDMTIVNDIKSAFDGLFSDNKTTWKKIEDFIGALGNAFGVPLKNTLRTFREWYNIFENTTDDISAEYGSEAFLAGLYEGLPFTSDLYTKSDKIYRAYVDGDEGRINVYRKQYKTEESFQSALNQALREHDSRIGEAAELMSSGDISGWREILDEIADEGIFEKEFIEKAIRNEANHLADKDDEEETEKKPTYGDYTVYTSSDMITAFESGNNATALKVVDELIQAKMETGMTEKEAKSSLRSSFTSHYKAIFKEAYKNGDTAECARIRKLMKESKLYGNTAEVIKTYMDWQKEALKEKYQR